MKRNRFSILIAALVYSLVTLTHTGTIAYASGQNIKPPSVNATSAVLIDADTGIIIYEKSKNLKLYPASITKIMTTLLTLEYAGGNFTERIQMSHDSVYTLPRDASHIAMDEGETLSIEEALHGVMLASANEVSNALAEHIAGTTDAFADMMTARAKELGAYDTSFTNPHGLHNPNHYTTAYDMAQIMLTAVKNEYFRQLINTKQYQIPPTERKKEIRYLNNSHKMIQPGQFFYNDVVGGKTGFTDEAQHTLVTYAARDGINLIAVIMYGDKTGMYTDTAALFDYGFSLYGEMSIMNKGAVNETVPVRQSSGDEIKELGDIQLTAVEGLRLRLPYMVNQSSITREYILPKNLTPPVTAGDVMGKIVFNYGDIKLGEVTLAAENTIDAIVFDDPTTAMAEMKNTVQSVLGAAAKILAIVIAALLLLMSAVVVILRRENQKKRTVRIKPEHNAGNKRYDYKTVGSSGARNYRYRNN